MACRAENADEISITSSTAHKQDQFWENIIIAYEKILKKLKQDEIEIQERLYSLKILIQAVITYNLVRLLDQGRNPQMISRLIKLKCICPKHVEEETPLNIDDMKSKFNIANEDLKYMGIIKELTDREHELVIEVNKLRIKDSILTQMKIDMDTLMQTAFPGTFQRGATSGTPSELPNEIQKLLKDNRMFSDELCDLMRTNRKLEDSLNGPLANELQRTKKKNDTLECEIASMKHDLYDTLEKSHMAVMKDILERNWNVRSDLRHLVDTLQTDVNILKEFIHTLRELNM